MLETGSGSYLLLRFVPPWSCDDYTVTVYSACGATN